jgi:hypothetical protein
MTSTYIATNSMVLHFNGDLDGTGDCIKCIADESGVNVQQFILQDASASVKTIL